MKNYKILFLAASLLAVLFFSSRCQDNTRKVEGDPLKAQAKEKYREGRRLFLTCDPANYGKALQLFEEALALYNDYPQALAAWAETLSMWYGYMLPEELFQAGYMKAQRAIRINPELDMGYRAMADLWRHRKDPETGTYENKYAMEVIERAIKINPDSAENLYVKGSVYMSSDPEKALQLFNRALSINPNLGKIYFNMASVHQRLADVIREKYAGDPDALSEHKEEMNKHYQRSVDLLDKYQQLVPGSLAGYTSQGIAYMRMAEYDKAKELFQEAVSKDQKPDPSQIRWRILSYFYLAAIAEQQDGDLAAARALLERALEPAPNNLNVLQQLVRISRMMDDEEAAKKYEQKAKKIIEENKAEELAGGTAEAEDGSTASAPAAP